MGHFVVSNVILSCIYCAVSLPLRHAYRTPLRSRCRSITIIWWTPSTYLPKAFYINEKEDLMLWLLLHKVLRLQYQKEVAQAHITVQTKFNFAWGLVKSPVRENQVEGVRLLQGEFLSITGHWPPFHFLFLFAGINLSVTEIYRAEPTRRRECLYYLALGHYKMGNFDEAKKFNGEQICRAILPSAYWVEFL